MDKVTVVVPVYNTEHQLERCVSSLITQTYLNLEIILVNDGSTDNSLSICNYFSQTYPNIKVFSTENHGPSHARNIGLTHATGDYICFCDADDWVERGYIEELIKNIEENQTDMSVCNWFYNEKPYSGVNNMVKQSLDALIYLVKQSRGNYLAVWGKLFKKDQLPIFDESIAYLEDGLFLYEYLLKVDSVSFIEKNLYHYTINTTGLTHSFKPSWKQFTAFEARNKMIHISYSNAELLRISKAKYQETVRYILFQCYRNGFYSEIKQYYPLLSFYQRDFFQSEIYSLKYKLRFWGYGIILKYNLGKRIALLWEKLRAL